MDETVKRPIRHNGAEIMIPESGAPRHRPPTTQPAHPHLPRRVPSAGDIAQPDIAEKKVASPAAGTAFSKVEGSQARTIEADNPSPAVATIINHKLRTFVSQAGRSWSKLSSEELRQTNAYSHNLCLLVQDRYEISRQQAEQQVREFFELHPR